MKLVPVLAVHGSTLHRSILIDLDLRRDARGHLSGSMTYSDRRKRLSLHTVSWHRATLTCGSSKAAVVSMRMRDKRRIYDATLRLSQDKRHNQRFTIQLGRTYRVSAVLDGRLTLACPAPVRKPTKRR
jgi:hypothetical protein